METNKDNKLYLFQEKLESLSRKLSLFSKGLYLGIEVDLSDNNIRLSPTFTEDMEYKLTELMYFTQYYAIAVTASSYLDLYADMESSKQAEIINELMHSAVELFTCTDESKDDYDMIKYIDEKELIYNITQEFDVSVTYALSNLKYNFILDVIKDFVYANYYTKGEDSSDGWEVYPRLLINEATENVEDLYNNAENIAKYILTRGIYPSGIGSNLCKNIVELLYSYWHIWYDVSHDIYDYIDVVFKDLSKDKIDEVTTDTDNENIKIRDERYTEVISHMVDTIIEEIVDFDFYEISELVMKIKEIKDRR